MSTLIYTKEKLEWAIKQSKCYSEAFRLLGARTGGATYQSVKQRIRDYGIDTSHFIPAKMEGYMSAKLFENKVRWEDVLVSGYSRRVGSKRLRKSLLESGRPYVCEICGLKPEWNGKPLTLQVDHRDGNWKDCRPHNIQFACPNCHTQMPTFCNSGKGNRCGNCNKKIGRKSKWCLRCRGGKIKRQYKVKDRPAVEILLRDVEGSGYVQTGKKYGVSDNAIRKWIRLAQRDAGL